MDEIIQQLYYSWTGETPKSVLALSANGSNRRYWRVVGNNNSCIASFNADVRENEAFFYYATFLKNRGVKVPEVFLVSQDRQWYLQSDLGDTTLYNYVYDKRRQCGGFDADVLNLYKRVLADLVEIQLAGKDMDFAKAYPRSDFDAQSMQWDLNYFKYYFLKMKYIPFDEELLERDFHTLIEYLTSTDCSFFLYRDFQSRNIMIKDGNEPYYIDFQGGRRGAAQYDLASLLYSAKSDIPQPIRVELLNYYIECLSAKYPVDKKEFKSYFYGYVLIRIMQAMGAYGYRGYFERKEYFLSSIPLAINNLRNIISECTLPIDIPHLRKVWQDICNSDLAKSEQIASSALTVTVGSFSYKKGLPHDDSGNGGGFIFDCRALPNPGRYPEYRCYTGKDKPVIDFFQGDDDMESFLLHAQSLVGASVKQYLSRKFTSLMVYFGCTGGQHRSVYCAEQLAQWLKESFDCQVVIKHREQS